MTYLTKMLGLALVLTAVGVTGSTPALANCGAAQPAFQGFDPNSLFQGCGTDPRAFHWVHKRGVQRIASGAATNGAGGIDSGAFNRIEGQVNDILQPHASGQPDAFTAGHDYGNSSVDGCPSLTPGPESAASCTGLSPTTNPVTDVIVSGRLAADPLTAYAAVVSVDANEPNQFWILDQAGAASADGNPCGADSGQFKSPPQITCQPIPRPNISPAGTVCDTTGCNLPITVGAFNVAGAYFDDCAVAHDKATNCPRGLDGGRRLFFQRGSCLSPPTDTRSFAMQSANVAPPQGTVAVNSPAFSREDNNLNGVLDAGEDGANGGTVNGALDPFDLAGPSSTAASTTVRIPKVPGATDCVYLGVGLLVDATPIAPGEKVVSPFITFNPFPISVDNATPVSDRVLSLRATKSGGKASVSWITSGEFTIAGFDLIGIRKNGSTVKLNPALIKAQFGTTGESGSYNIDLTAGDLKGVGKVAVEVKHTNGSTDRTDPVPFE